MPEFSKECEATLHRALNIAKQRHHEYATIEHLLLGLTSDADALKVLFAVGADVSMLEKNLIEYVSTELGALSFDEEFEPKPTAGFQRVVQRSVIHVQSAGREFVTGANILVAVFAERESHAALFLTEQDITRYDCVNFNSHGIYKIRNWEDNLAGYLHSKGFTEASNVDTARSQSSRKINKRRKRSERDVALQVVRKQIRAKAVIALDLSSAMMRLAQLELKELEQQRPNSPEAIERNNSQIELMRIFADGFASIAGALSASQENNENSLKQAAESVISLSESINQWWNSNNQRLIHLSIGIPVMAGAVGTMKLLGADAYCQAIATGTAASAWFGRGVVDSVVKTAKNLSHKSRDKGTD